MIHELRETLDRLTSERDEERRRRGNAGAEERIEELEEALRESVRITADREVALDAEMQRSNQLDEKVRSSSDIATCSSRTTFYYFFSTQVGKLEQRLQSIQNAQNLKCRQCRPNRRKLQALETRLGKLLAERRTHLHELFDMKYSPHFNHPNNL